MFIIQLSEILKPITSFFNSTISMKEVPASNKPSSGGSGQQINQGNIDKFIVKAIGFQGENDSGDFSEPEYDLTEIKSAVEADSYIAVAIHKYTQLIFKAGYSIVSKNENASMYIRNRLRLMSFATGVPIDVLLQQIADDLIRFSNVFLIKSRVETQQLAGIQAKGVYDNKPVGGYFRVDPTTVKIKRDKNGTIKQYQQEVGSNSKSFKNTEVVHIYIDKEGGAAFGTPRLTPVLEDVKMLRKIEGNSLVQIYRYANPITQMKIGVPEQGLMATDQEISDAKSEVEKMNSDGIIVTNERTEFHSIGAEGEALDITKYLAYFEARVFSALNVSASQMGRGGAKQDADSMEEQVHDTVKFFQRQIAIFIENEIFRELLLEGGFNPILNEDDIVRFKFDEINLETRVKMETHALNLFQGNAVTFEEMRYKLGKDAESADESRLYQNMIKTPADLALIEAKSGGSANTGTSGPSRSANSGSEDSTKSTMQPSNQHGTTTANVKESKSSKTLQHEAEYRESYPEVYGRYEMVKNDILLNGADPAIVLPVIRDNIIKDLLIRVQGSMQEGVKLAVKHTRKGVVTYPTVSSKLLEDRIRDTTTRLFKDIRDNLRDIGNNATETEKEAVFAAREYRLRFLTKNIVDKAYWFGYVKYCQEQRIPEVYVHFGQSPDRDSHSSIVNTGHFTLDDIPGFNAYCHCRMGQEPEGGGDTS